MLLSASALKRRSQAAWGRRPDGLGQIGRVGQAQGLEGARAGDAIGQQVAGTLQQRGAGRERGGQGVILAAGQDPGQRLGVLGARTTLRSAKKRG